MMANLDVTPPRVTDHSGGEQTKSDDSSIGVAMGKPSDDAPVEPISCQSTAEPPDYQPTVEPPFGVLIPSPVRVQARLDRITKEAKILRAMLKVAKRAEEELGEGGES